AHAQGTISYTTSPVHTMDLWVSLGKQIEDMGAHSICIKDMAGLLKPYDAYELVSRLKKSTSLPIHMQCHATTGLSVPSIIKAAEAGIDNVDTAISSMSMTYGHSPTETIVASLENTEHATGLDLVKLEEIAAYFREIRKKYAQFEGSLKGVDGRILVAQVPGGMLTNMESQLKEQGAADKFDEVMREIPRVREDLGFIPLVTPTSQIVGTQAVINVMNGERYKTITKETAGVLKGEYGATPAPVNKALQDRVLEGGSPITGRPADLLEPEMEKLIAEVKEKAKAQGVKLADSVEEDALIDGMFAQAGWKYICNRGNKSAFEAPPGEPVSTDAPVKTNPANSTNRPVETYLVNVDGRNFNVSVSPGGAGLTIQQAAAPTLVTQSTGAGVAVEAPMAGNILKILVNVGSAVSAGEVVVIMEAMKMETEVRSKFTGIVSAIHVKEGAGVAGGDALISLG
ncbi:MAG: pyruvate carboxylase subunit B, partial [Gammaproteobacteria bacterium]